MQIEALQLLRNQREQGFEKSDVHQNLEIKLGGYKALHLRLTGDGNIHSLNVFSVEDETGYWCWIKGTSAKTKRFPALRLIDPLFSLSGDSPDWEILEKIGHKTVDAEVLNRVRSLLVSYCDMENLNPQDFWDAWDEKAAPVLAWTNHQGAELLRLQRCVKAFGVFTGFDGLTGSDPHAPENREEQAKRVAKNLAIAAKAMLSQATDKNALEALVHLLAGKRIKKKGKVERIDSVQICIDNHEAGSPLSSIYTPQMRSAVLTHLPKSSQQGNCALTGKPGPLLIDKFPPWRGKVSIYSKNKEAPCNMRYRRAGLDGFPVLEDAAQSITGGLKQMIAKSREGKTWTNIYNGKYNKKTRREEKDLLLAYPSFPVAELRTIDIFLPPRDDDGHALTHRFEEISEALVSRLKAKGSELRDIPVYLQILVVRQVSEGQDQLVFSDDTSLERVVSATDAWRGSGKNLPASMKVPLPSSGLADDIARVKPRLLFPEEISRLLTHQWVRNGTESSRVEAPSIGTVFELFLRKPGVWQNHAESLLETTLIRAEPLLVGAGHVLHKYAHGEPGLWKKKWGEFVPMTASGKRDMKKADPRYELAKILSLIGSLLYAMNSTVEEYTNQSAFLVGKLLALMDELHRCYCIVARNGDIPNALIGNGLLGRAAESPAQAFADLLDRSRIYVGWAKTVEVPQNATDTVRAAIDSARHVLRIAAPLSESLHKTDGLDGELIPARKAHLFLGYLSSLEE